MRMFRSGEDAQVAHLLAAESAQALQDKASRDEHLRSADFFNVAEFPRITFKSSKVTFSGDMPSAVEGNLTLLGVSKLVSLTFERFKCGANPFNKKARCGGNAVGKIKRSDFGMKAALPAVGDEIALNIEFEGDKD